MAGEQLMLVDGQPQTIVVDQQPVAYQQTSSPQQQFIVQETNVEQLQNSQVYYTQDNMQENSETATCDGPIVLNNHLQSGQLRGQIIAQKVATQHLVQQQTRSGIAQPRQQLQVNSRTLTQI